MSLESVFTDELNRSFISKVYGGIEVHHIFGGDYRKKSTEYKYVVPLHYTEHPNGSWARMNWTKGDNATRLTKIDEQLKQMAQKHFEENHGSREDFIQVFGRSYL